MDMTVKGALKKPPHRDPRNDKMLVFDLDGNPHEMTLTNAREMVRNCGWTLSIDEAAGRKKVTAVFEPTMSQIAVVAPPPPVVTDYSTVWEDLTALPKDLLSRAAKRIGILGIDGRTNEKRSAAAIDDFADQALAGAGDFEAPAPADQFDTTEQAAEKQAVALARRRRAFAALAARFEIEFTEATSIVSVVETLGKED